MSDAPDLVQRRQKYIQRQIEKETACFVRMITPKLYAWKGTKWIRQIEFLAEDRKGF